MPQQVRRTFDILKAKALLRRSGKGYPEIAQRLGVTRQAVGHWFRERGEPDVQQLKGMAEVMGCHWLELVTEDAVVLYREDERRLLETWRALPPEAQQQFQALMEMSTRSS